MKSFLIAGLLVLQAFAAEAQLAPLFKSLDQNRKGPFSVNVLQGSRSRINVLDGLPSGTLQFQAAYRNDIGLALANGEDFYVGNLFTTNYYELMGEYVYGDARSSHDLNHEGLLSVAPLAMPKAGSMVRHWVLEKHYIHQFQNSALSRAFRIRGISGVEFEQEYAKYFLNFFLTSMEEESQFLAAWLLAKGSPLSDSASLERARNSIAALYDNAKAANGANDNKTRRLYQLRNAIHNQLSQSVIGQIDAFLRDYPKAGEVEALREIRGILVAYYSVSAKRIADAAKKMGEAQIQALAEAIAKNGSDAASNLKLSELVANLRTRLTQPGVIPYARKTDALVVLMTASQFLNKELLSLKSVKSLEPLKTVMNLIYIEGFLIKDNWEYFSSEINAASGPAAAAAQLPDIVGISSDTLVQAFSPALDQWIQVEPKMNYFIDNTIKSSALNTASVLAQKIK